MADDPISQLPVGGTLTGAEQVPASYFNPLPGGGWTTYRYSVTAVAQFAQQGGLIPTAPGSTGQVLVGETAQPPSWTAPGQTGELLIGSTANDPSWLPAGTTGQFLTANTDGQPAWASIVPGEGVSSLSFDATGLTPSSPTGGDIVVGGKLNVAYGGTGAASFTSNALLYGNGTSAIQATLGWSAGDLFIIDDTGAPTWLPPGTVGQFLQTGGAGEPPAWSSIGSGVTTISFGSTGLTPNSGTSGDVTVSGTLATSHGGTNLTTFGAANRAIYSTSSSALTAGTLPIAAGGTGATAATGTGNVVLASGATLSSPTINNATFSPALSTGLTGFRNRVINGAMYFDQRHAGAAQTFTAGAAIAYCVDRMYGYCTGANVTGQRVASAGSTASPEQLAYQFTGAASVTKVALGHRIAARDSFDLAGGDVTVSFNVKTAGSGSPPNSVTITLSYANVADNFSAVTLIGTSVISGVTSTEAHVSATFSSISASALNGLQCEVSVGALVAGQTFLIGNWQIEGASAATAFERRLNMVESLLCRQRFETSYCGDFALGAVTQVGAELFSWDHNGDTRSGQVGGSAIRLQPKAATPTIVIYSTATGATGKVRDIIGGADVACSATNVGKEAFQWSATGSSNATGAEFMFHWAAECEL